MLRAASSRCITGRFLLCVHSLKNLLGKNRKRRSLKLAVVHIPGDDFVVLSHALNHQILDKLAHAQLELVQRVGHSSLDHLAIAGGSRLDLVEEQAVLIGEGGAETLVEHLESHEGWIAVADDYDDGGFSGGNMERPALKRLMADIQLGKVDIVVVYKIDRLSRSLADFARMVDVFDRHRVSFSAVTQQINSATSMGRLMLNVLLSFAQFEREVTGERIRDKIAASKAKGMWMGGPLPLGYDVDNRLLVINEKEAALVRCIFNDFVTVRSATLMAKAYGAEGVLTKGGKPFTKQTIYKMLHNRMYLGEIVHKGQSFPGQHRPSSPRHSGMRCTR